MAMKSFLFSNKCLFNTLLAMRLSGFQMLIWHSSPSVHTDRINRRLFLESLDVKCNKHMNKATPVSSANR